MRSPDVKLTPCTDVHTIGLVEVEWDPEKARSNLAKHGVSFADAALALEDEAALTMREDQDADEQRFVAMGLDPLGRVLLVVYTYRDEALRIISARKATRRERIHYERQR